MLEEKMGSSVKDVMTPMRTGLNPNAAEFVPSALRAIPAFSNNSDVINPEAGQSSGKTALGRNDSPASGISDNETQQYWQVQLPDDITPDFDLFEENSLHISEGLLSGGASALDYVNASKPPATESLTENGQVSSFPFSRRQKQVSPHAMGLNYARGNSKSAFPQHGGGRSSGAITSLSPNGAWEHNSVAFDQQLVGLQDGLHLIDGCDVPFLSKLVEKPPPDDGGMDPVEFLAMEFPGFAAESLADIFHANGGDLSLTIEMLTQLELQDDAGPHRGTIAQPASVLNLNMPDFPNLSSSEMASCLTGVEIQQATNIHGRGEGDDSFFCGSKISADSQTAIDFAAAVRRSASQQSGQCRYERNSTMDQSAETSRISQVPVTVFTGDGRVSNRDRPHAYATTRPTDQLPLQMWFDMGELAANTYSDPREEAQDHAGVQNAYLEQARQALLTGNKALAKELSVKGQWHNGQMKAAYNRAGEANFHQRNLATGHLPKYTSGQVRLIDLHGLHVSEAIRVLNHELAVLRSSARSTCQRQHVFICVGTGQHTKGSRTPARLPIAVERYLVEDEHLDYTEPQPGMLQVVIY